MKKRFCSRPYNHLHFDPDGNVRVCSWTNIKIGNVFENTIEEIWHGEQADKFRKSCEDNTFKYCNKESCPFLENDSLEYLDEVEYNNRAKVLDLPNDINIANDLICNHSCPSCRSQIFKADKEYLERLKKYNEILVPLLNQARLVSGCGAGDLFASNITLDMLSNVQPLDKKFIFSIETNGVLFTPKNWEKISHLAKYEIDVTVTPNSFEENTFCYLNGGHDDYNRLISSLKFLSELRQENKIKKLDICIVVQEKNYAELPSFIERCIEEFRVDRVIARPIYHWFYMNDDDYWFKDVSNPLHPYHKSWLKVMAHPILNHEKVYLWGARNLHAPARHPAYRYEDLLKAVTKLVETDDVGEKITKFLTDIGKKNVLLYGETMLTATAAKLLKDNANVKIMALNPCSEKISDITVQPFCVDCIADDDCVVVLNTDKMMQINRDFSFNGYKDYLYKFDEFIEKAL